MSKQNNFFAVECDVCFTNDGVPVLLHYETVDRTSDGHGKICDLTFEEVRSFDFGSWKSEKYAGEKIPSFEEFLRLCVELKLYPYIELKGNISSSQIDRLAEMVYESGVLCTWIARYICV